jgi:hypothetical protein
MRVCGQELSQDLMDRIQQTVDQEPTLSRVALSRRVCEWLNWRSPNGKLKEMSCRVALLTLHRRGTICLPAAAAFPGRRRPGGLSGGLVVPPPAVAGRLADVQPVELIRVGSADSRVSRVWHELMSRYHYLGAGPLCGAQMRYVIRSATQGWLGGLAFSAAAWQVGARDRWIGWSAAARRQNLPRVVANSRLLILPQVRVPHLASHVLGLCVKRLPEDWQERYGYRPLLLETFVERERFKGTCYRAANWQHVGGTCGRGRQDGQRLRAVPVKDLYLYPLEPRWRERLGALPEPGQALPDARARQPIATQDAPCDWAHEEFGGARLGDARLHGRLLELARDFYAKPRAQIPQACGTRAKAKAAYRFFDHPRTTMDSLLPSHYEATTARVGRHAVVLAAQDTTSLNYNTQPAIKNLGPIGSQADGAVGLLVHDTMAFTPQGVALGLIDVQCWARDENAFGKRVTRHARPIEQKESYKWLTSVAAAAQVQRRCPHTTLVSVGDREADVFELFDFTRTLPAAPKLLIRAERNRTLIEEQGKLWEHLDGQPIAGYQDLPVPRRGHRQARVARMAISYARVELKAPQRKATLKPVTVWAVWAREIDAPHPSTVLEWMLLTTCEVHSFEQATERLAWYATRWNIEVYHRTLKSGCQIETRQLGSADRIEACLAIDMVVAWRILHLTKLGRDHPDVPCTVYFAEAEWNALLTYINKSPVLPSTTPPSLREATRMVASLGGFLGRHGDGDPGTQTLWLGLQRLDDLTAMYLIVIKPLQRAPPTVSSGQTYG